jgi:hypothetical protein
MPWKGQQRKKAMQCAAFAYTRDNLENLPYPAGQDFLFNNLQIHQFSAYRRNRSNF